MSLLLCLVAGCKTDTPKAPPKPATPIPIASETAPEAPPAMTQRAKVDFETAKKRAKENPNDPQALIDLAFSAPANQIGLSAKSLRTALRLSPASLDAYRGLLAIYESVGYDDRVLELHEMRIKAVPQDLDPYLRAATFYVAIEAPQEAQKLLESASKIAPDSPKVISAWAVHYYKIRKVEPGIQILVNYLKRFPNDHYLTYRLSELQRSAGKFEEAEKSIRAALALQPDNKTYQRQLAHILATCERPEKMPEAEAEARKLIASGDKEVETRYWLAVSLDNQKRFKDALPVYEEAAKSDIQFEKVAYRLGKLYQEYGRAEEGKSLLRLYNTMDQNQSALTVAIRNFRAAPNTPANHIKLAETHFLLERRGIAIAILRRAVRLFPSDAATRQALRSSLLQWGRKAEAKEIAP